MKQLIICVCLLATLSCRKGVLDPTGATCDKILENYTKSVDAWSQDPTSKTKCEAVKQSLNDVLKSCSVYTAAQRKFYEDQLKDFTCN